MRILRLTLAISICGLTAFAAGCAKQDFAEERERLELNKAKWAQWVGEPVNALARYDFFYHQDCECKYNSQEAVVSVLGNAITAVVDSGKVGQLPFSVAPEDYTGEKGRIFFTVDEWFAKIDEALQQRVEFVEIDYDEKYGSPSRIRIDYSKNAMHDEIDAHLRIFRLTGI